MKYILDKGKFKKKLLELGYRNLAHFAAKNRIHRNTLHELLTGKSVFSSSFDKIVSKLKVDSLEVITPQSGLSVKIHGIEEIRSVIARLVKSHKDMAVILIGSRAGRRSKPYSDWDLGVFAYPTPLSGMEYLRLKGMVEDETEDLVREVDLINLNQAPVWFLEDLADRAVFLDGNRDAFLYFKGILDGIQKEKIA